ncbi:hypothetical protein [Zarconia navalis]|nr:hypothetical protein [Zarconia navalis]
MGAIFVSFIVPQAIALVENPGVASSVAIERVLLMSCLCAGMCWFGYQSKPNLKLLKKLNVPHNDRKLRQGAIVVMAIGYFFLFLLSRTTIQFAANSNWTGPATIYIFFSKVIYIALAITVILALKNPTKVNIILALVAGLPIVQNAILVGRRQPTFAFLVIIGVCAFYVRRLLPPRLLTLGATVSAAYIIPILGQLRGDFWSAILNGNISSINFEQGLNRVLEGNVLEFRNAAILMDAAAKTGHYGYGTGFWDAIVFQYVPGQLLGYGFKNSLQFNLTSFDTVSLFDYSIPNGSTTTGIGDTFLELGYFGCIIFYILAYYFKNIWISAVYQNSVFSQLLYASIISPSMAGITHGIDRFFQEIILQIFVLMAIRYYLRN